MKERTNNNNYLVDSNNFEVFDHPAAAEFDEIATMPIGKIIRELAEMDGLTYVTLKENYEIRKAYSIFPKSWSSLNINYLEIFKEKVIQLLTKLLNAKTVYTLQGIWYQILINVYSLKNYIYSLIMTTDDLYKSGKENSTIFTEINCIDFVKNYQFIV